MNGAMRNIMIGALFAILPPAFAESRDGEPILATENLGDPVGSVELTGKSVAVGVQERISDRSAIDWARAAAPSTRVPPQ